MSVAPINSIGPVGFAPIRGLGPVGSLGRAQGPLGIGATQPGANARVGTSFGADEANAPTAPLQSPTLDAPTPVLFAPVQQADAVDLRRVETTFGDPVNGGSADSPIIAALANVASQRLGATGQPAPRADTTPGMVARAYSAFAGR